MAIRSISENVTLQDAKKELEIPIYRIAKKVAGWVVRL